MNDTVSMLHCYVAGLATGLGLSIWYWIWPGHEDLRQRRRPPRKPTPPAPPPRR